MTYATQADIEDRYPGELAQAGPRDGNNALDAAAIALACASASATLDRTLRAIGWTVPLLVVPDWVTDLTVDLALYQATPTALASQADFSDRKARYQAALDHLAALRRGDEIPEPPAAPDANSALTAVYFTSTPRVFGRDAA